MTTQPDKSSPFDDISWNEAGLLILCWSYFLIQAALGLTFLVSMSSPWWLLLLLPVSLYVADALSGLAHLFLDYRYTTPGVGLKELYFYQGDKGSQDYLAKRAVAMSKISPLEKVVFDFKTHHLSPGALARRSFLRLAAPMVAFIGFPVALLCALLFAFDLANPTALLLATLVSLLLSVAQYAHSCSHRKENGAVVTFLQHTGIFISREKHDTHHQDLGVDFCILSGIANPLVNRIFNFFRRHGWVHEDGLTPI